MRRHWQYLKYVLRHKWFVFVAGIKRGVPIHLLIMHDISKFRPSEWFGYARTFYAPNGDGQYEPDSGGMAISWLTHIHRNKHHWQYWVLIWDRGDDECLPMPARYREEMLADWMGAGQAQSSPDNTREWYRKNRGNMKLHKETRHYFDITLHWLPDIIPAVEVAE